MAKQGEEKPKADKGVLRQDRSASIDMPVKVKSLGKFACTKDEGDPYHDEGEEFVVGSKKAKELEERGWVEIIGPVEFKQPALKEAEN